MRVATSWQRPRTLTSSQGRVAGPWFGRFLRISSVAQVTVTEPESFTIAPYVRSTGNPDLIEKCGLDVALILDVSGSIGSGANLTLLKDAAKAFITGIEGTGSKASITTFSTAGQVLRTAQVMDATNAADFRSAINGLSSTGGRTGTTRLSTPGRRSPASRRSRAPPRILGPSTVRTSS